ncbi:MAG: TatD family hydrolase [Planctomycetes bacterium]|nr:TatD family hydrolase [Planctomycetota bacterium]
MITDSHAHLYWKSFDEDRAAVLARARAAGVTRMVVVGTNLESSRAAFALCAEEPGLFPTAGIHPQDAAAATPVARAEVEALCRRPECVGVGEAGLDWFKNLSPRAAQLDAFLWQLELARELDKPVVIHCRDAHADTERCLAQFPGVRGVMHCYSMGPAELAPYLAAGLFISFSGVVTYPKNEANRAAAAAVPLERLLVETDCPYLAPQGKRGKRNEPAFVLTVLEELARVRGTSVAELAHATSLNAARLFVLPV